MALKAIKAHKGMGAVGVNQTMHDAVLAQVCLDEMPHKGREAAGSSNSHLRAYGQAGMCGSRTMKGMPTSRRPL